MKSSIPQYIHQREILRFISSYLQGLYSAANLPVQTLGLLLTFKGDEARKKTVGQNETKKGRWETVHLPVTSTEKESSYASSSSIAYGQVRSLFLSNTNRTSVCNEQNVCPDMRFTQSLKQTDAFGGFGRLLGGRSSSFNLDLAESFDFTSSLNHGLIQRRMRDFDQFNVKMRWEITLWQRECWDSADILIRFLWIQGVPYYWGRKNFKIW